MEAVFESSTTLGHKKWSSILSVSFFSKVDFHSCLLWLLFQKLLDDQWLSGGCPSTTGLKLRELNVVHPLRREESSAIGSFISLGGSSCMSLHGELCMNSQAQAELAPVFSGVNSGLSSTTQCFIG